MDIMNHDIYDKRKYPIVEVKEGYGEWVHTYEQVVQDEMDLRLLDRLRTVNWSAARSVLDLACGTGRIGAWLKDRTSAMIDGVDITPEMLEVAQAKGIYRALRIADVASTGLPAQSYDLCVQSLADEHMAELQPLYAEVTRVIKPGGKFVIVGFHPQFLMAGVPTHFNRASGEPITIRSYVHLLSDHVKAAHASALTLLEMDEGLIDQAWLLKKPKWEAYFGLPISFAMVWERK
ncbi:MAG TPA: class I SAM-dependent methyltransferase [Aggregatilineales bacterium]|nr:class I SAM-dependent methyltransferase [Aggregatilineales bacterium]